MDPPPHIIASTNTVEMSSSAGNSYFTVQADEDWSISTTASTSNWLEIMNGKNNLSGTKEVMLYRQRNTSRSAREGYITIRGRETGERLRIRVKQDGR